MAEFVTIGEAKDIKSNTSEFGDNMSNAVQKAKEAAEIQEQETKRIKAQREAIFAENDIKDTTDLKTRIEAFTEREKKLALDSMEFDNRKATETSQLQKSQAEYKQRVAELVKREQDLITRTKNIELREKLIQEREELMNSIEKQKLKETDEQNSLLERLRKSLPRILALLGDNANKLDQCGFVNFADDLWDGVSFMQRQTKNDFDRHCNEIVSRLKMDIEDCNYKAVEMARNPKIYNQPDWDLIVDNLEECYTLLPEIRPPNIPRDIE